MQRRRKNDWLSRRFPTDRKTLLRDIRELCGEVSQDILAAVEALPERHPGFVAHHEENMAQYHRENPSAGRGRTRPDDLKGVPVVWEGSGARTRRAACIAGGVATARCA